MYLFETTHMSLLVLIPLLHRLLHLCVLIQPLKYPPFAGQQPQVIILLRFIIQFFFCLKVDVEQFEGVPNEVMLDESVQRSVRRETRGMIHFQ
jgi:hypothetical protein